jgi:hypothetical protein
MFYFLYKITSIYYTWLENCLDIMLYNIVKKKVLLLQWFQPLREQFNVLFLFNYIAESVNYLLEKNVAYHDTHIYSPGII